MLKLQRNPLPILPDLHTLLSVCLPYLDAPATCQALIQDITDNAETTYFTVIGGKIDFNVESVLSRGFLAHVLDQALECMQKRLHDRVPGYVEV